MRWELEKAIVEWGLAPVSILSTYHSEDIDLWILCDRERHDARR